MAEQRVWGGRRLRWLLGFGAVLLSIALLIGSTPAGPILGWLAQFRQPIHLQGVSGTIWRGQAELAALRVGEHWLSLGQLQWQLAPSSLLVLAPKIAVQAGNPDRELAANITVHANRAVVIDNFLLWGKAQLGNHWLPAERLRLDGEVSLTLKQLIWRNGIVELDAALSWDPAILLLQDQTLQLGALDSTLMRTDEGDMLLDVLSREEQPLMLMGQVRYNGDSVLIDLRAKPAEDAPESLKKALRQLAGSPDEEQFHTIKTEYRF